MYAILFQNKENLRKGNSPPVVLQAGRGGLLEPPSPGRFLTGYVLLQFI
jgi:hypothetical protein